MDNDEVKHDIEWNGHFEQFGNKTDMSFRDMQLSQDGKITGGGKDAVGEFHITGALSGDQIDFKKQYVGAHAVTYCGALNNGVITGKWDLNGMNGGFELKMKTKQWKGYYEQGGHKNDMLLSLDVADLKGKRSPVRGIGADGLGGYIIQGFKPVVGDGKTILFTKKYFGRTDGVHYAGVIGQKDGQELIRGSWVIGSETGFFELVKQN